MTMEFSIIIKTFERKDALIELLISIEELNIKAPIIILDDSKQNYKTKILDRFSNLSIKYIVTDFDIGLSKGRNILVENTQTKYFILCDDDFVFDKRLNLNKALQLIEKYELDILGGMIYNNYRIKTLYSFLWMLKKPKRILEKINKVEYPSIYNGNFSINDKKVELKFNRRLNEYSTEEVYYTDICSNFFIAKTDSIKSIKGWQPESVKVGEHQAFFLRAKMKELKVGFTPLFGVKHYPMKKLTYNKYRLRSYSMINESFSGLELDSYRSIDENGNVIYDYKGV